MTSTFRILIFPDWRHILILSWNKVYQNSFNKISVKASVKLYGSTTKEQTRNWQYATTLYIQFTTEEKM